jgi:ABC-2 type transport system ATP-binding protein
MTALIELEEITKDYGAFRALDRVSCAIGSGITGLLGPNGAGKSTLIKVLLGLLRATSGRGHLLDYQLGRHARAIRSKVGYMPEDDCFWVGLTGVESVQLSAQLSRSPRIEALRRAHEILDFCGLAEHRYRTVETYSTGMRQKLRFAQAIVHDPPILILDEPTSGLDPEERESMLNRLTLLARDHGKAILLCTHILPDVQATSDSVVILVNGRVRLAGCLQQLSCPASPSIRVRVLGESENYVKALRANGMTVESTSGGMLTIMGPQEELSPQLWRIARQERVGLQTLVPSRNSLEEIFLTAVREEADGSS